VGAPIVSRLSDALAALAAAAESTRPLGPWGGLLLVGVGLAALTVATRFPRPLAVLGGAIVGALAALAGGGALQTRLDLSPAVSAGLLATIGALGCGAYPAWFPFVAGAVPGALLGGSVPLAGSAAVGAAAGGALGGAVGALIGRGVVAVFACLVGGCLLAVGLVTLFQGHPLAGELTSRPFALGAVALVPAIAGAAFQLSRPHRAPVHGPPPLQEPDGRRGPA
jgi:hypothetical protein